MAMRPRHPAPAARSRGPAGATRRVAAPLPEALRSAAARRAWASTGAAPRRAGARGPGARPRRASPTPSCPSWRGSSAPSTPAPTTRPAPATPAASRPSTCWSCARGAPISAPDLVVEPGVPRRGPGGAGVLQRATAWPSSRSAAAPRWSAGCAPTRRGSPGVVALDLRRLNALVALDEESRLAVLEPGLRGPEAEALLGARGYTLGHFPQSFEYATLGGFAAARSSGQSSAGYGRFDERVLALRLATPAGTLDAGSRSASSAAGPDLRQLVLGSEGTLGVITSLTLAVDPAPEHRVYEGWMLPSFAQGTALVRRLAQDGPRPTVLRLSDEAETAIGPGAPAGDRLGGGGEAAARRRLSGDRGLGGLVRGGRAAPARHRGAAARAPAASRCPAPATDGRPGATAAPTCATRCSTPARWWRRSRRWRSGRRCQGSTRRSPPRCATRSPGWGRRRRSSATSRTCIRRARRCTSPSPAPSWRIRSPSGRPAKAAAGEAILAAGGSITHHHGVGADHRELVPARGGRAGRRGAARGQAHAGPGRDPQPRDPPGARGAAPSARAVGADSGMM